MPEINDFLKDYDIKIDKLEEYPSTFGYCFDKDINVRDECTVFVRGFILDREELSNIR